MTYTKTPHKLTVKGVSHTYNEWSKLTGLTVKTLYARDHNGWSEEDILKPARRQGKPTSIEIDGVTKSPYMWAKESECGLSPGTIMRRYSRGVRGKDLLLPTIQSGHKSHRGTDKAMAERSMAEAEQCRVKADRVRRTMKMGKTYTFRSKGDTEYGIVAKNVKMTLTAKYAEYGAFRDERGWTECFRWTQLFDALNKADGGVIVPKP